MRICFSIGFNFTRTLTSVINGLVSLKRVNDFLLKKELNIRHDRFLTYESSAPEVNVKNLQFSWKKVRINFYKQF
jgi:hypothetical protein